ncbi:phosphoglucosamine mutase [Blochmannia endosymbiont of Camponotus (Colobopsis) obliquus]|uniref:phosphoglucosamine mutase n=1 Tax=Blochmannia endosymbiont of Camponotus (Colobopsis) obliquus TaxID=1505597 RepID=UPI00061A8943|nr:phosphoglucosamine mutase [Blochmannia endosymbiont of Camponotus (Colobopsis) obliquus]AKC60277.1 phosphoglucosamine mutase [Blochmannia endosymbiont of Camponotus (Colobopsis) obliquus]
MKCCRYFGTDGIRGKVGESLITPEFILKLGWAIGKVLGRCSSGTVIIGKDTRISGYMLESALEAGLSSAGLSSAFTGPMPTPAIAYLTRTFRAEAGIVISASHNPYYDNGIKFFSIEGTKLSSKIEEVIETYLSNKLTCVSSAELGKASRIIDAAGRYIEFCKATFPTHLTLKTLIIVVDCANGATYHIAPSVLSELGAKVITVGCHPDGMNINKKCGTTDVRQLRDRVLQENADVGIAYDGDGDRVIMIDHFGNRVNGDKILYVIAREKLRQSKLEGGVVGTLMSNMGLVFALQKLGIPFVRSHVGDRYIIEMLNKKGWRIGAENSGHIILLDYTTTGDGIIASLQVLSAMITNNISLYNLCSDICLLPQILLNVNFARHCINPLQSPVVKKVYQNVKYQLLGRGRVLLRQSGTEPCIRVMVEGDNIEEINYFGNQIVDAIKSVS